MSKNRMETFSDGVIAIIITIMVLEITPPEIVDSEHLGDFLSNLLTYIISFVYVGIYWINHHHFFNLIKKIDDKILWANLFLLFSLSLIPLATSWINDTSMDKVIPMIFYGVVFLITSISNKILILTTAKLEENTEFLIYLDLLKKENDNKDKISIILYLVGIMLSFISPMMALIVYGIVGIIWIKPDQRIQKIIDGEITNK